MDTNELISKYSIKKVGDQMKISPAYGKKVVPVDELEEIKARKPEIMVELTARATAAAKREANIAAIEGIDAIISAQNAEEHYSRAFDRMMENESNDGARPPHKPTVSSAEMINKYPRAAAYLQAEGWTMSSNLDKYCAGKKALERIINGEDYTQVIAEMEAEWSAAAEKHVWD